MYDLNFSSPLYCFTTQYDGSVYWWVTGVGELVGFVSLVAIHPCSSYKRQSVPASVVRENVVGKVGTKLLIDQPSLKA
jgi:hypothetical protein